MGFYRKNLAKNRLNIHVVIMFASLLVLAVAVLGGEWYTTSHSNAPTNEHLVVCDPPSHGLSTLPASVQLEIRRKCSAQATLEAPMDAISTPVH